MLINNQYAETVSLLITLKTKFCKSRIYFSKSQDKDQLKWKCKSALILVVVSEMSTVKCLCSFLAQSILLTTKQRK